MCVVVGVEKSVKSAAVFERREMRKGGGETTQTGTKEEDGGLSDTGVTERRSVQRAGTGVSGGTGVQGSMRTAKDALFVCESCKYSSGGGQQTTASWTTTTTRVGLVPAPFWPSVPIAQQFLTTSSRGASFAAQARQKKRAGPNIHRVHVNTLFPVAFCTSYDLTLISSDPTPF